MRNLLSSFPLVIGIAFLLLQTACQKNSSPFEELPQEEEVNAAKIYPQVDQRLWPFFQSFEEEAALRDWEVDLSISRITASIEEIDEEHVAGQCSIQHQFSKHITIDLEFWNRSSNLFKEFIIFHELGHCYLRRDHREDAFANGACKSLMRSGTEDCIDNYNSRTRATYIDELFNPDAV